MISHYLKTAEIMSPQQVINVVDDGIETRGLSSTCE